MRRTAWIVKSLFDGPKIPFSFVVKRAETECLSFRRNQDYERIRTLSCGSEFLSRIQGEHFVKAGQTLLRHFQPLEEIDKRKKKPRGKLPLWETPHEVGEKKVRRHVSRTANVASLGKAARAISKY
ncbi:MAG: hypothetical protein C0504_15735, partial [Candidatus Solibacter sp.]|nr:hypothetical protein [Candidatus Solibacter sp.]